MEEEGWTRSGKIRRKKPTAFTVIFGSNSRAGEVGEGETTAQERMMAAAATVSEGKIQASETKMERVGDEMIMFFSLFKRKQVE